MAPIATPGRRSLAATRVPKLNEYSARITDPKSQGASQAVLYEVGLNDADLRKPQVGISPFWYKGNTCNMHLLLSLGVRDRLRSAGMVAFCFNTVGVSDTISMGTRGMCYSLPQHYDANNSIPIPGCDKNVSQVPTNLVF